MKALFFRKNLELDDMPEPTPQNREALIQVKMAGICNTDIEILNGYMNFQGVIGHEFVGVVKEANSDDQSLVGKRVVGEINIGCGKCEYCLKGLQRHCTSRGVLGIFQKNGAFAEYLTLPIENLLEVPDSINDAEAVFVEPLAASLEIFEQIHILPGERIAVIGDGKLGLLTAMVCNLMGCQVSLIGKHPEKMNLIAPLGIDSLTPNEKFSEPFQIVVEASGNATGLGKALEMVAPRGTIVLKSTYHGEVTFDTSKIVIDEINLLGSRCGRFGPALRLLAHKQIDLGKLITATYPLADFKKAFEAAQQRNSLKVLFEINN